MPSRITLHLRLVPPKLLKPNSSSIVICVVVAAAILPGILLACLYAASQNPSIIYLVGFDIVQEKYRNIYEGTLHYPGKNSKADIRVGLATKEQLCWTFYSFPYIEFRRVSGMAIREFERFRNYRLIKNIDYEN